MADFEAIKSHFTNNNLTYYSFFPKSQKPFKPVIRHLPINTLAQDISEGLENLGFDFVSVKPPEETINQERSLVPDNLPADSKITGNIQSPSLCHISLKVETYMAQTGLTQCHNCQQFGHVWANCKQPPCCLWCGGGHLHKESPEKGNAVSTLTCCNCLLAERDKPHPVNYRGCRQAREELQKRKAERTRKTAMEREFSSNLVTPGESFVAALRGNAEQRRPQANPAPMVCPTVTTQQNVPAPAL
jgi:hypothetical protein